MVDVIDRPQSLKRVLRQPIETRVSKSLHRRNFVIIGPAANVAMAVADPALSGLGSNNSLGVMARQIYVFSVC